MRYIYLALFILITATVSAQDDYPDYRSKKELFTRLQEKDIRNDLATFTMGGIEESVGKDSLHTIPIVAFGKDFMTWEAENMQVTLKTAPFDPTKHKFTYYDPEKTYLLKIDNKPYFGNYGTVPKTVVEKVTVILGRDTIVVPPAACTDLANPVLTFNEKGKAKSQNKVFLSKDGRKIYVYMLKPEAGGSYEATWVIQDRKYFKRIVDFGFLR